MKFLIAIGSALAIVVLPFEAAALSISPVRIEISVDPGETVEGELLLINEQEGVETLYSSFGNFEATGETGTPTFVTVEEGLATWIETTPEIILEPKEQKEISYVIHIPEDADPGGHFAAIFWGTSSPQTEEGGEVSVATKLGVLVLLRVSGEIEEGGGILEFSTENKQGFFNSLPVNFTFRFQNSGNDRIKPEGEIIIRNIFGKTSAVLPANKVEGNILPQSIRKFEVEWNPTETEIIDETETVEKKGFFEELKNEKDNFAFGRYTAELDLEYGGEKAQASFSFFIIPWRILTLAAIFLMLTILIIIKGIKRYNRWVIAKAQKG